MFSGIKERIWNKIHNWQAKSLSQADRMALLKAVIQAMPTYVMSCFRLPDSFLREIESMMLDLFWSYRDARKAHWVAWDKLLASKKEGGLSLRNLRAFNQVMLAKQVWLIASNPNNLLSSVMKFKYFLHTDFFDATPNAQASFTWRCILEGHNIVISRSQWRVGNDSKISIMADRWLSRPLLFRPILKPQSITEETTINILMLEGSGAWNEDLIHSEFCSTDSDNILLVPLDNASNDDTLVWHFEKSGRFLIRSAYYLAKELHLSSGSTSGQGTNPSRPKASWLFIWSAKVP